MKKFLQKYDANIIGTLSGFDRLVFRGALRILAATGGMVTFLRAIGVTLKDFGEYVEQTSARLHTASLEAARSLEREVEYLPSSKTAKDQKAREIAAEHGITEGLICVLRCVEPCMSYELEWNPRHEPYLKYRPRKCLHLYHYWIHPLFGFMSARIQTWFPFHIQVCLNGREWLAHQMDSCGLHYERYENCFPWLEDNERAQALMDQQLEHPWRPSLNELAQQLNPLHDQIFEQFPIDYYWSIHQSEWATDIMFESPEVLEQLHPLLVRGAISSFSCADVMRFLGRKPHGSFQGKVTSKYKDRPEGVRVRHSLNKNSEKLYNKFSVLRPECTINDPTEFKVFRPSSREPDGPMAWRDMRKGVADIRRRAEVSQNCNERYLEALASLSTDVRLRELVAPVCHRARWKKQSIRGLRPWTEEDALLLKTINRGEYNVNGFRNRDLLAHLHPGPLGNDERRRKAAAVTRKIRMLRAHHIIQKVSRTHLYRLTPKGREIVTAILQSQDVTLKQLNEAVA